MYGYMFDGMLCVFDELGIGVDDVGIIILLLLVEGYQFVFGEDVLLIFGVFEEVLDVDVILDIGYCMLMCGIVCEVVYVMLVYFCDFYDEEFIGLVLGFVVVDV